MQNEAFEAYQTMKDLEGAGSSDLEWEFMLLLLTLLGVLALCMGLFAFLVHRARARRARLRSTETSVPPDAMLTGEFRELGTEGQDDVRRGGAERIEKRAR